MTRNGGTTSAVCSFLACDDCGRPDVCERLGECNLLIPPASSLTPCPKHGEGWFCDHEEGVD